MGREHSLDAGNELCAVGASFLDKLHDIVVHQPAPFGSRNLLGGQDQHRQGSRLRPGADQLQHLKTIDLRHHQIQNDSVGHILSDMFQPLCTVFGNHNLKAVILQGGADLHAGNFVIFHDKNAWRA